MRLLRLMIVFASLLSGCATWSETNQTGSGIFAWNSEKSAALVVGKAKDKDPMACMQFAQVAKSTSAEAQIKIAESLLAVMSNTTNPAPAGEMTAAIQKVASALNTTTERTSFLMVGSFYACQLQANGMSEGYVKEIMLGLIKKAGELNPENFATGQRAPEKPRSERDDEVVHPDVKPALPRS
ncbi:hypothetical protein V4890_23865 [Ralstonia solanacearum species complex bacterium KE056]|uniref:hypothetical protein n=1 Tax=Ralstonia solanacearum species complex bacterium KE056 TaxID=3119585 RepID=UPI002FC2B87C